MSEINYKYQNILIIQTAFLGDTVLSIPLIKITRYLFPWAHITLVCRLGIGDFFNATGLVDQVIEVNKKDPKSLTQAFSQMKLLKSDLILSPHRSFRTAWWIFRLRPKMSIGFQGPWSFLSTKKAVPYSPELHDVLRQASLLNPLGIETNKLPKELLSLHVNLPKNQKFDKLENRVAISPGSQWNTKKWTLEGFKSVARELNRQGRKIVLFGSKAERILGDDIVSVVPDALNLCGETNVLELGQALAKTSLLICNDSGTMHVASAMGIPVVSIFGPTVTSQGYAPWNERSKVVEIELYCRPCGAHGHQACPIGTHDCMKKISPSMVLSAANEFLK